MPAEAIANWKVECEECDWEWRSVTHPHSRASARLAAVDHNLTYHPAPESPEGAG